MTGIASTLDGARDTTAPTPVAKTQGAMRTLTPVADRKHIETARPPAPAAGEVQIAIRAVGLNHIEVWGRPGMAFAKRKALGADHVINCRTDRFESAVHKLTGKKGVDVVFEHVGPDTFNGSPLCLKRGGRLVTSGQSTNLNLFPLYIQQYRIIGSFGASMRNIRECLSKMASGILPVIDTEVTLADFECGLARLESRQVFEKIIVTFR